MPPRTAGPRLVLWATCLGTFIAIIDTSLVNLGLKSIQVGLHADMTALQWLVDLYNLVYAAFIMMGGVLGDRVGRKRVFVVGTALFGLGSLLCALAPTVGLVIAGRGIAGLGAALELPASLAILNVTFAGAERERAIALWASANGLAMGIGPTVGGLLITALGWRSLFYLILPFVALTIGLALAGVQESSDPKRRELDLPGQALVAPALAALAFWLIQAPVWGWGSPAVLTALVAGVAGVLVFVWHERRTAAPMVPLDIFARTFSTAVAGAVLMTFGMYSFLFVFPIFLQTVQHRSPVGAGLALLPMSATFFLLSSLATGRLVGKLGARALVTAGMGVAALGLAGCALVSRTTPFIAFAPALLAIGAGLGLMTGPISSLAVSSVPKERSGTSSGLFNVARMVGATAGVAMLGVTFGRHTVEAADRGLILAGMRRALLVAATSEMVGALLIATLPARVAVRMGVAATGNDGRRSNTSTR